MKIRYHTWYWGKYVLNNSKLDSTLVTMDTEGFEEYIEESHGEAHMTDLVKMNIDDAWEAYVMHIANDTDSYGHKQYMLNSDKCFQEWCEEKGWCIL